MPSSHWPAQCASVHLKRDVSIARHQMASRGLVHCRRILQWIGPSPCTMEQCTLCAVTVHSSICPHVLFSIESPSALPPTPCRYRCSHKLACVATHRSWNHRFIQWIQCPRARHAHSRPNGTHSFDGQCMIRGANNRKAFSLLNGLSVFVAH